MSFRDFTIDQIAGDMLPTPTRDQLIATGFNRNSMINQEGGIDVEEYYWYSQVDRVNTTASVWLGATLGCAQCHNHKFDPFTQKDYYRFLAFYNNANYFIEGSGDRWAMERRLELPTPEQEKKSKELRAQVAQLEAVLVTPTPQLQTAQASWELDMKKRREAVDHCHSAAVSIGGRSNSDAARGSIDSRERQESRSRHLHDHCEDERREHHWPAD